MVPARYSLLEQSNHSFFMIAISRNFAIAFSVAAIINMLDMASTYYAFTLGKHELNPILAAFEDYLMIPKCIAIVLVLVVALLCERTAKDKGWIPIACFAAITSIAVINNMYVISKVFWP